MTDEIMRFAANFKTLDDPAKIHGICRMTLPPDHSDAVLLTDHSGRTNGIYMESDEALKRRINESLKEPQIDTKEER